MIIGLTGGIATGKTTVTKMLQKKGYRVLDADIYAAYELELGTDSYYDILNHFGEKILNDKRQIDRSILGDIIFSKNKERDFLNGVIHPRVKKRMLADVKTSHEKIIFLDVPLLFEAQFDTICDKIIVVQSTYKNQLSRLMKRNNFSETEARLRIASQMGMADKTKRADYVIDNNETEVELKMQIDDLIEKLNEVV